MNVIAAVCLGLLAATAQAADKVLQCNDNCKPWAPTPTKCGKSDNIDFRVAVGLFNCTAQDATCGTNPFDSAERTDGCTDANGCVGYLTHFYCGEVDEFTSFTLARSAEYLGHTAKNEEGAPPPPPIEMAVYGHGKLSDESIPSYGMNSRVPVYQYNHSSCPDDKAAIASFLVYNLTLDDGKFKYKNREPVGNGFVNTCDDDECSFSSDNICLTDHETGASNCAQCIDVSSDADKNAEYDVRVLLSYYGSDSAGKMLLSGSSNPLNFRQFAVGGLGSDIASDLSKVKFPSL